MGGNLCSSIGNLFVVNNLGCKLPICNYFISSDVMNSAQLKK